MQNQTSKDIIEASRDLENIDPLILLGQNDVKFKLIKSAFPDVKITARGTSIKITGAPDEVMHCEEFFDQIIQVIKTHGNITIQELEDHLMGNNPAAAKIAEGHSNNVIVYGKDGKPIKAKTHNQKALVDASKSNDILFAVGPAGTGKTYTAVALAVAALKSKVVKKIILTRPAVEAGESLGFLPGDLKDKIDPYLRPLYDALDDLFPADKLKYFMENRVIEVAPLAYMRGRTLDNAYIILDEAQNCTSAQLKMFLTRLGPNAKCIITGDVTQVDLPYNQKSGLKKCLELLSNINGIAQIYLNEDDVVRHRLVKEIIKKYNANEERERLLYEEQRQAKSDARREEANKQAPPAEITTTSTE